MFHVVSSIDIKLSERIKFNEENTCWEWIGTLYNNGYGRISINNKSSYVHRLTYELYIGKIPTGKELDHLCRNRRCCNPEHLEAVTHRENIRRGKTGKHNSEKTHCKRGHPYTKENTHIKPNGWRQCKLCTLIRYSNLVIKTLFK